MEQDFTMALLRLFIFLPLVLLLAYATVKYGLGRAHFPLRGTGRLQVVARLPLGQKSALLVVRCGNRYFLLGVGEGPPVLLAELPDYTENEVEVLEELEENGEHRWKTWSQKFQK